MDWNQIEKKWQQKWREAKIFQADPLPKNKRKSKQSKGCLVTFPFPYLNGSLLIKISLY
jgi:leucyl-tRNA synthetase